MLRRTFAVFSSLIVALLLIGATSAHASEYFAISASGTASLPNGPRISLSVNVSKYIITSPTYRVVTTGRVICTGVDNGLTFVMNTNCTDVTVNPITRVATFTAPFSLAGVPYSIRVELKKDEIGGDWTRWNITGGPKASREILSYMPFTSGTFSYTYRRF